MNLRIISVAAALLAAILCLILLNLRLGPFDTTLADVWRYLWFDDGSKAAFSVREIRLPRALNALFAGAALALSGTLIQVIIRNPLGDPGLTGVTSGAALGVAMVVTYYSHAGWAVVLGGISGGALAATLTLTLARGDGMRDLSVILFGIAVSVFLLALTTGVMILNRASTQTIYYWMIGGFANKGWIEFAYLWPWTLAGAVLALAAAPMLELLRMQDGVAAGLGLQVGRWRLLGGALSVVLAAVAVAVAGPIGFVGFVAPHLVRRALAGSSGQVPIMYLLPLAALAGALLTLGADYGARALPLGNRAPAGVLVSVFGGAAFLILARRLQRGDA